MRTCLKTVKKLCFIYLCKNFFLLLYYTTINFKATSGIVCTAKFNIVALPRIQSHWSILAVFHQCTHHIAFGPVPLGGMTARLTCKLASWRSQQILNWTNVCLGTAVIILRPAGNYVWILLYSNFIFNGFWVKLEHLKKHELSKNSWWKKWCFFISLFVGKKIPKTRFDTSVFILLFLQMLRTNFFLILLCSPRKANILI